MRLTLKSGNTKPENLDIDDSSTVDQFRAKVAEVYKAEPSRIVIIFAGKIIKDGQKLSDTKVDDGMTVHIVVKKGKNESSSKRENTTSTSQSNQTSSSTTTSQPTTTSTTTPSTQSTTPNTNTQFGMSPQNFQEMQNQMLRNPEMMSRLISNPMVESLMQDQNLVEQILNSNPQMQNLIQQNPDVASILRDPNNLRQAMDMFRDPNRVQEMMRNHDTAMRNLESMPGGFNALARMHQDVLNPMEEAMSMNPFATLAGNNNNQNQNNNSNTENNDSVPDAWGSNNANNNTNNSASGTGSGMPTIPPNVQQAIQNRIANNPELIQTMLRTTMGDQANNPQLVEQMQRMFGNPEVMQALTRPEVRDAMTKIQEGFATLNREAPDFARAMGLPQLPGLAGLSGLSNPTSLLNHMNNTNTSTPPSSGQPQENPEIKYKDQLEQLTNMGFADRAKNIRALIARQGNVQMAVNWLLEN